MSLRLRHIIRCLLSLCLVHAPLSFSDESLFQFRGFATIGFITHDSENLGFNHDAGRRVAPIEEGDFDFNTCLLYTSPSPRD